jgi:hypothetical protein
MFQTGGREVSFAQGRLRLRPSTREAPLPTATLSLIAQREMPYGQGPLS